MKDFFDTLDVRKFKTKISYGSNEITGMILYKKLNDSINAGTFINEFGIKGFDFKLAGGRVKTENLIKNINKWYIRKSLESDLLFLFLRPKMVLPCSIDNTLVYVSNVNHSLHYVYYLDTTSMLKAKIYKRSKNTADMVQYYDGASGMIIKLKHTKGNLNYELSEFK